MTTHRPGSWFDPGYGRVQVWALDLLAGGPGLIRAQVEGLTHRLGVTPWEMHGWVQPPVPGGANREPGLAGPDRSRNWVSFHVCCRTILIKLLVLSLLPSPPVLSLLPLLPVLSLLLLLSMLPILPVLSLLPIHDMI